LSQNVELQLDVTQAQIVSPLFWPVPTGRVLDATVGSAESGEFRWQSRVVTDGWKRFNAQTRYGEIAGANHFTVVDPLADVNSGMVARLTELAEQVKAIPL
jgi:arylformamidase